VCTPVDPLFLALPYLIRAAKVWCVAIYVQCMCVLHFNSLFHMVASLLEMYK